MPGQTATEPAEVAGCQDTAPGVDGSDAGTGWQLQAAHSTARQQ